MTDEERKAKKRAYYRAYDAAHPDKAKAKIAKYRATHADKIKAARKARRLEHLEEYRARDRAQKARHREAKRAYDKAYHAANRDKVCAKNRRHKAAKKDYYRAKSREWTEANRDWVNARARRWRAAHPGYQARYLAQRCAHEQQATPAWVNMDAIKAVYAEAVRLTRTTGIRHEVDHIYPLRGRTVCGLHCEANLQILTRSANRRKSNLVIPHTDQQLSPSHAAAR